MNEERRRHEDRLLGETIVRLEAHETADSLMFKQINKQLADIRQDMKDGFAKVFGHFWTTAVGVIFLLLGISGYLYIESSKVNKEFMLEIGKIVAERNK